MDINKLKHYADFNLTTKALGVIRCGPFGTSDLSKFDKLARADNIDCQALARELMLTIARKLTDNDEVDSVCGGAELTEQEATEIAPDELDDFCNQFIARRLRITPDTQPGSTVSTSSKKGCEGLAPAILAHTDSQRAQMDRILGQARSSVLGGLGVEGARKFMQDNSIAEQIRKSGLGDTISDHMRKLGIGSTFEEQTRRDMLGISALEAAYRTVKASDNLGETIAALRASDASKYIAIPVEPKMPTFTPLDFPPNPIIETNRLLRNQQAYTEEMRPTIIRSAELIQTLTDTTLATQAVANDNSSQAERHAKRSMRVAIFSIVLSAITSCISIYYANASPTALQADQLAKEFRAQFDAVSTLAKADRTAFEKNAKEDRAVLSSAIEQQSKLISTLATSNIKATKTNSEKSQ